MKLGHLAASVLLLLPLAGCGSDQRLNPPDLTNNDGLFARYVAMGNSITAGLQSGGINDQLQREAYPRLVASRAGAPFFVPSLAMPGCPPPLVNNVTGERLGGAAAPPCALREEEFLPWVSNVAVPLATSFSPTDNQAPASNSTALTTFILGGRTQVEAMQDADPTFVSLWIGNNDVLGALTNGEDPGNEALITPLAVFQANYDATIAGIEETGAAAALFAVMDVAQIPFASTGATYWCLSTGACPGVPAQLPPALIVDNSCAPMATGLPGAVGDSVLVPWPVGVPRVAAAAEGTITTLDCTVDTDVVLPSEYKAMRDAAAGYNAYIQQEATERGWAFVDLNPTLAAAKAAPLPANPYQAQVVSFPILPQEGSPTPNVFFGTSFSLDGVHPSTAGHRIVADSLISAVNQTYDTSIPLVGP